MFRFENVKFLDVLDLPSLMIEGSRITTLFGESGSGKTTILKLLNKMLSPTEGNIYFKEQDISEKEPSSHRRIVTMLSQEPVIFEGTIEYNLNAGRYFQDMEPAADETLKNILKRVDLKKNLGDNASKLSGGEKQRLALARVMLLKPEVYLLDEPSSSLDEGSEEMIFDMFSSFVKEEHKTLVMVTHSRYIAKKYSDRIIYIKDGREHKGEEI
jgi:putative ABC transport system ATP-binding protein